MKGTNDINCILDLLLDCFACSLDTGFRVYNISPLTEKTRLEFDQVGSVSQTQLLYRCNLLAVVGGGLFPQYSPNDVLIWDDLKRQFVLRYSFKSSVLAVRMRRNRIIVVLSKMLYVFSFPNTSKLLYSFATAENPNGLCEISSSTNHAVLVFPGKITGRLQLIDLMQHRDDDKSHQPVINAHENALACIALNHQGSRVATASVKGTLIRIFDTSSQQKLFEFRRGLDPATLYCMNFSLNSEYLCASSDKGTVHIFALNLTSLNRRSALSKIGLYGQYVDSVWDFTNFTIPLECACICAFTSDHTNQIFLVICINGTFHKYKFSLDGVCTRTEYGMYLCIGDNEF
ncbi:uncharacterized protein TRIADDRAFT_20120 [Trichoplax adhaerens]|uniref:WD repeat domain phosphoinositide-interacting protein 4 n=1 Tax=Trichoplax adhaerens TaxID=10228 RepID=B3RKE4_TRIAD|nr:hypothetical protein TRIADDRAFT_20120 [Trichoplax adhaerens]EDV29392.1 hypothetical protein TRIADDRAFT_20120 [Trichoplax adhaerens]|eukprot:XP_002108594.1 hypothetical protein TRIADDRAFT_20120 [Trichoplax adhaerens]